MRATRLAVVITLLLGTVTAEAAAQKRSPAVTRDSDHDGVPDMRDRCPGTPAGLAVDATGCPTGFTSPAQPAAQPAPAPIVAEVPPPRAAPTTGTRVGIGVGVGPGDAAVLLPIQLAGGLIIEPEVTAGHNSVAYSGLGTGGTTTTDLRVGVALRVPLSRIGALRAYAGPVVGLMKQWTHDDTIGAYTVTSWYAGAALGGEFFLLPRASLGAELQARYRHTHNDVGGITLSGSDLRTTGLLAGRWYFR